MENFPRNPSDKSLVPYAPSICLNPSCSLQILRAAPFSSLETRLYSSGLDPSSFSLSLYLLFASSLYFHHHLLYLPLSFIVLYLSLLSFFLTFLSVSVFPFFFHFSLFYSLRLSIYLSSISSVSLSYSFLLLCPVILFSLFYSFRLSFFSLYLSLSLFLRLPISSLSIALFFPCRSHSSYLILLDRSLVSSPPSSLCLLSHSAARAFHPSFGSPLFPPSRVLPARHPVVCERSRDTLSEHSKRSRRSGLKRLRIVVSHASPDQEPGPGQLSLQKLEFTSVFPDARQTRGLKLASGAALRGSGLRIRGRPLDARIPRR